MHGLAPDLDGAPTSRRASALCWGWWVRRTTGQGVVVPDGSADLLWSPGRTPWLAGPDTGPRSVSLDPGSLIVGLRLRTGVAGAVVGDGVDQLTDRQVDLDQIWGRAGVEPIAQQLEHLAADADPSQEGPIEIDGLLADAIGRCLAAAVVDRVADDWCPDPMVAAATSSIIADRTPDPGGLSARQFRRRFTTAIGYGPARYARVARLARFANLAGASDEVDRPLAHLAAAAGYHDEAHLARDCRALTGRTPAGFRLTLA